MIKHLIKNLHICMVLNVRRWIFYVIYVYKQPRLSFFKKFNHQPKYSLFTTPRHLELYHIQTLIGASYFLTIVDDQNIAT